MTTETIDVLSTSRQPRVVVRETKVGAHAAGKRSAWPVVLLGLLLGGLAVGLIGRKRGASLQTRLQDLRQRTLGSRRRERAQLEASTRAAVPRTDTSSGTPLDAASARVIAGDSPGSVGGLGGIDSPGSALRGQVLAQASRGKPVSDAPGYPSGNSSVEPGASIRAGAAIGDDDSTDVNKLVR